MKFACKICKGPLTSGGPGYLECKTCKREMAIPESKAQSVPFVNPAKAPEHGLLRKEMLASDAYQPEMPEFGKP